MPISRQDARELMNHGYEMGAKTLNGTLRCLASAQGQDGVWVVDDVPIAEWLQDLQGCQVVIIAAEIREGHGQTRTCPVCGSEYEAMPGIAGYTCPRCRQARTRLRGRG